MGVGDADGGTVTAAPPRVSVVVPVRDRRALLRRLLDALAAQTLTDHEVVVVDDHSSDGSREEALADERAGRPVRVVQSVTRGAVPARRAGVDAARAPFVAFTDSDCVPDAGWLAAGIALLESGADVVQGVTRPLRPPLPLERTVAVDHDDGLYATCNVFYRRSAYDAAGGFDLDASTRLGFRPGTRLTDLGLGEDTLLGWRVRRAGSASFAADAVVHHHVFDADLAESLRRAWTVGAFPSLVREVPELRQTLLLDGMLLGDGSRLALYAAAIALLRRRKGLAGATLAGWAVTRAHRFGDVSWKRAAAALPADLAVDVVAAVALAAGSVRARTLVL
jgi:hypothetical protein